MKESIDQFQSSHTVSSAYADKMDMNNQPQHKHRHRANALTVAMSTDTSQQEGDSGMDIDINMDPRPMSFLRITRQERNSHPPTPGKQLKDHFQRCMRRHEETSHPILVMTDVDDAGRAIELWEGSYTGGRVEVVDGSLYLFEFNSESHCIVAGTATRMFDAYLRNAFGLEHDDYEFFIGDVRATTVTTADNTSGKDADARFKRVSPRNDPSGRLPFNTTTVVIEVGDCQSLADHRRITTAADNQAGGEQEIRWCPICLLEKARRWIHQNNAPLVMMIKLYGKNDPSTKNGDRGMLVCLMTRDRGVFQAGRIGSVPDRDIQRLNEYNRTQLIYDPNARDIDIQQINVQEERSKLEIEIEGHLIFGMDEDPRPYLNTIIADASQPPAGGIEEDEIYISIRQDVRIAAQALYARVNNNGGTFQPCRINLFRLWLTYRRTWRE